MSVTCRHKLCTAYTAAIYPLQTSVKSYDELLQLQYTARAHMYHSQLITYRLVEMEIKVAEAEERACKLTAASAKTRCGDRFLVNLKRFLHLQRATDALQWQMSGTHYTDF